MYNTNGKENAEGEEEEEEDVKGIYILVSGTLVVVTSAAVNGTTSSSIAVVHVRCSLYPKIHLWYDYSPTHHHQIQDLLVWDFLHDGDYVFLLVFL
jgi:hypothetical protein